MKVNLHITEKCNYTCKQCFAKFDCKKDLSIDKWKRIVSNCIECGIEDFNIAGGEPFLYKNFNELVEYIYDSGATCSIITNASLLDKEWILRYGKMMTSIGISIDSISSITNSIIGRETNKGEQLDKQEIIECIDLIRKINPMCSIKINTVVSKLNALEDMRSFINIIKPDRWKLLRMHIYKGNGYDNSDLAVTDEEYENFIRYNIPEYTEAEFSALSTKSFKLPSGQHIVFEGDMEAAYIMIDSRGYLVDNSDNHYTDVICCYEESFTNGLNKLTINNEAFWSRYEE